jgi:hypothetical protein
MLLASYRGPEHFSTEFSTGLNSQKTRGISALQPLLAPAQASSQGLRHARTHHPPAVRKVAGEYLSVRMKQCQTPPVGGWQLELHFDNWIAIQELVNLSPQAVQAFSSAR